MPERECDGEHDTRWQSLGVFANVKEGLLALYLVFSDE